jgi:RNA polymerase sigma factor (sigma-70 family)
VSICDIKEEISQDIIKSTYCYFRNNDLYFRDYVYGDPFYITLEDVIYKYLVTNKYDWDMDYRILGSIDTVRLVSRLYEVFIRADTFSRRKKKTCSERYRKNYIMKCLRRATFRLLQEQFDEQQLTSEDLYHLHNYKKKFRYLSIYSQDGKFLEDLSYKRWKEKLTENEEIESMRTKLDSILDILDDTEKCVIEMVMKNRSHSEIAEQLRVEHDKVRKLLFYAKKKLQKAYRPKAQQLQRN